MAVLMEEVVLSPGNAVAQKTKMGETNGLDLIAGFQCVLKATMSRTFLIDSLF
jgi:hypothetical protein